MEKINKEEFYKTAIKARTRSLEDTPILKELNKLEINEGVKLLKDEWNKTTTFPSYVQQSFRSCRSEKKFTSHVLKDGTGWLVLRIK